MFSSEHLTTVLSIPLGEFKHVAVVCTGILFCHLSAKV